MTYEFPKKKTPRDSFRNTFQDSENSLLGSSTYSFSDVSNCFTGILFRDPGPPTELPLKIFLKALLEIPPSWN